MTGPAHHAPRPLPYADRAEAGRALGRAVAQRWSGDVVVLGLPRGGVPVAAGVAAATGAPLDVFVVRKLGAPGQPELALGALASGGVRVVDDDLVQRLHVSPAQVEQVAESESRELRRREEAYRRDRPPLRLAGRTAVLVDDGLATGSSALAAVQAVRALEPARVVVAVPVGAPQACQRLARAADDVVCLHAPEPFGAVGAHYLDFRQTTDEEVQRLLAGAP